MQTPPDADPPGCRPPSLLWSNKHLWKHNLRKLRLRAVKMFRKYTQYMSQMKESSLRYTSRYFYSVIVNIIRLKKSSVVQKLFILRKGWRIQDFPEAPVNYKGRDAKLLRPIIPENYENDRDWIMRGVCPCSSGSSGRVRGPRNMKNLCVRLQWPSFLWLICTGPGGGVSWPPWVRQWKVTAHTHRFYLCIHLRFPGIF